MYNIYKCSKYFYLKATPVVRSRHPLPSIVLKKVTMAESIIVQKYAPLSLCKYSSHWFEVKYDLTISWCQSPFTWFSQINRLHYSSTCWQWADMFGLSLKHSAVTFLISLSPPPVVLLVSDPQAIIWACEPLNSSNTQALSCLFLSSGWTLE